MKRQASCGQASCNSLTTSSVVAVSPSFGKICLDAVTMRFGVQVRHRVHDQRDVVTVIVGVACRRLHTAAGGDAGQDDLRDAAPAQDLFQPGTEEGADPLLGHGIIARLPIEFGNEVRPIRRRVEVEFDFGTPRCATGHVHKNDRQTSLAESARKPRRLGDDFTGGVRRRQSDKAFLQVDHDQSGSGVELCQRHGTHFLFGKIVCAHA